MKSILLLLVSSLMLACEKNEVRSCEETPEVCPGISIVKEEISEYSCTTNIYEGIYLDKRIFAAVVVDPACLTDGSVGVYSCYGEFIDNVKPGDHLRIGELLVDNR